MSLLPSELLRLKSELGFNVLTVGAEPYIGWTAIFDQVIAPNLTAGAVTTSSSSVTGDASCPTPSTIVLASATGFAVPARIVVDVDARQETVTLESLSGVNATALFTKSHSGTYPVTVEGGESIVREYLQTIRAVKAEMASTFGDGMIKKADEVEFYNANGTLTLFGSLGSQLAYWRDELASVLGIESLWRQRRGGAARMSVY